MIGIEDRFIEKRIFKSRLILIYIFFGILFSAFIYRTYNLQVYSYSSYELASIQNKTRSLLVQPKRGIIYDRNGNILINNVPSYDLIIQPAQIENISNYLDRLNEVILIDDGEREYVLERFENRSIYNRELAVKRSLSNEEIARFEVRGYLFPEAIIDKRYRRESEYPHLFSHVLGFVGGADNENMSDILNTQGKALGETLFTYANGYLIGKTGIENTYDDSLRGFFGERIFEVDAKGKLLKEIDFIEPKDGFDTFTSLDLEAQKVAFEAMAGRKGAVVVVEIETGAIITYLSSPTFSINQISNGISSANFEKLISDKDKPFFDRVSQGRYSPASEPSLIEVNSDRVQYWLGVGAQPTEAVTALLKITGDYQKANGLPGTEGTLNRSIKAIAPASLARFALALPSEKSWLGLNLFGAPTLVITILPFRSFPVNSSTEPNPISTTS